MLECEAHNNEFGQSHHGARMNRMRPIRVCIVGPSPDIVGGQAVQAQRLCTRLVRSEELEVILRQLLELPARSSTGNAGGPTVSQGGDTKLSKR